MLLAFVVFSFFSTKARDWLGRTSPKQPFLCWVGWRTSNQLKCCVTVVDCHILLGIPYQLLCTVLS